LNYRDTGFVLYCSTEPLSLLSIGTPAFNDAASRKFAGTRFKESVFCFTQDPVKRSFFNRPQGIHYHGSAWRNSFPQISAQAFLVEILGLTSERACAGGPVGVNLTDYHSRNASIFTQNEGGKHCAKHPWPYLTILPSRRVICNSK